MSEPTNGQLTQAIRDGIGSPYSGVSEALFALDELEERLDRLEAAEAELARWREVCGHYGVEAAVSEYRVNVLIDYWDEPERLAPFDAFLALVKPEGDSPCAT